MSFSNIFLNSFLTAHPKPLVKQTHKNRIFETILMKRLIKFGVETRHYIYYYKKSEYSCFYVGSLRETSISTINQEWQLYSGHNISVLWMLNRYFQLIKCHLSKGIYHEENTVNSRYLEVVGTIFYKFKLPEVQINLHFG